MQKIIECVPNFSEGRNPEIINAIADSIRKCGSEGQVKILNIDPGEATNRTVITFAGSPEAVVEAAFRSVSKAAELIDMRQHHGAHPRSGATDVLPLVPISGVTLEECAEMSRKLAERIYRELGIPCYCYEAAAYKPERKNLAVCRAGEYEALPEKIKDPESPYTHILTVSTPQSVQPTKERISIGKQETPIWIDQANDDTGVFIGRKTTGIKYVLNGIGSAYTDEDIVEMKFSIKKN